MKRQGFGILLTMLMSMTSIVAFAYSAKVNGIYYNFSGTKATVTSSNSSAYSGNVVIPETVSYNGTTYSVTSIGSYAFLYCRELTSVTIPNSVTSIGRSAFEYCSGLTSVTIPNSVTSIDYFAFEYCSGLTSVTIPNSVTSIGGQAFSGCSGLTSVTIPNSVTSIGYSAFQNCSGLTSVTIPNSVTSIGDYAFQGCSGLKEVNYNATKCTSMGSSSSPVFSGCSSLTTLNIGNNVQSIPKYAFNGCSGLTSVTIGNSVTSIGSSAFYGCSGLTRVKVPATDYSKFDYVVSLVKSTIGKPIIILIDDDGNEVTDYSIPEGVTIIRGSTFYNCSGLKSITIPNSVTNIESEAFYGCSGLTSVTIPNSVTSLGSYAFYGCSGLQSVVVGNGVTNIPDYAFGTSTKIKSFTVGAGVLSISSNAFHKSSTYKPDKIIWLTNTPPSGYSNAAGTINYVANDLYTSLSKKTVYKYLSSLFVVDGVKYVPVSPSERTCDAIDCLYNENAENIHIGETVTNEGITLKVNRVHPRACYNNQFIKEVQLDHKGDVGDYAFCNCDNITTATIANAGNVGEDAFYDCDKLASVNITNTGNIGYYAFQSCDALTTATIANTGTIGNYAFSSCTALQTATLGEKVTGIRQYAFDGCLKLESIVIPNSVATIGQYAFQDCSSMTYVEMGNGVSLIDTYTFSGCLSLPKITIPQSVTKINNYVFSGCTQLKDVYIADRNTILTLGSNGSSPLFSSCPLDSVYIGGNISYNTGSSYGYSPFYRNTSLRSVTITDEETEISENEFYGCTNLKNVSIGDGVTTIGKWAFSGCSSLDYFAFGSSVTSIGQEAFSDCTAMTKLISHAATPPTCGSQALEDINIWTCKLEVPTGNKAAYAVADQWKEFLFVNEGDGTNQSYRITYIVDGETYKIVSVAYGAAITPEPAPVKDGYTFSGWSELPETMPAQNLTVTGTFALDQQTSWNTVSVNAVSIPKGGTGLLDITLTNSEELSSYQMALTLPQGVTVSRMIKGSRFTEDEHLVSWNQKSDGTVMLTCLSTNGVPFTGNDGVLVSLELTAQESLSVGSQLEGQLTGVTFVTPGGVQRDFDNVNISITIAETARVILDETSTTAPEAANGVDVRVKRTINAGEWSTICLPFAMTAAQCQTAFGSDVQIGDFTGYTYNSGENRLTVNFSSVTAIAANHPYIIKVSTAVTEFMVDGVNIAPMAEPKVNFGTSDAPNAMIGNYVAKTKIGNGNLFLKDNNLWYSVGNTEIKAFRAYFSFADKLADFSDNYATSRIMLSFGGQTTGVSEAVYLNNKEESIKNSEMFNLNGQRVTSPRKGLYIRNGKKAFVK